MFFQIEKRIPPFVVIGFVSIAFGQSHQSDESAISRESTGLIASASTQSKAWSHSLTPFQDGQDEIDLESGAASSHDGDVGEDELARAAQNPIADLISLPFQNNTNFNVGAFNHDQNLLNIQPVIPVNLNDDWNLITRTIVPLVYQPSVLPGDEHDSGLGDVQFTGFFSPKKPVKGWIVGAGPVLQFPTATDRRLGARKWTVGPSVVALRMDGPWVYGGLMQQVWSYAGSGDEDVSAMLIQPFVNYNLDDGWYLTSSPIITANWKADTGDQWIIPVGGGVGKIFRIGGQPMNAQVQAFYNVEAPDLAADWTLRVQLQFLFPR